MKHFLIFIAISFTFISCSTFFNKPTNDKDNIHSQTSSPEPRCDFGRELYQTLESILSANISEDEDSEFTELDDSPKNITSAFTHALIDTTGTCGVKSKLKVYNSKKGITKYVLILYKTEGNSLTKNRYKESFSITTNSSKELLKKTKTLFAEEIE